MESIVNIVTFFKTKENRTLDDLSKMYDDKDLLYNSIKELVLQNIPPTQIVGKKILLKPNFVMQCKKTSDEICLFTNPNVIFATLKVLLECNPSQITVGDAPIQDCHWEEMLDANFYRKIEELSLEYNVPIKVVDFRKVIYDLGKNQFEASKRSDKDYLIFDVGERSYLEPISNDSKKFRVTNYNPDRMFLSHKKGMHKYCIAKEVFEADIVITMPKPKTHRMACITNSLKILVGINGDKDYLPHHRLGSKDQGGDCYKDFNIMLSIEERLLDFMNRHKGSWYYRLVFMLAVLCWKLSGVPKNVTVNGSWHGNDTVWRMIMDLNLIAQYGKLDGSLSSTPQRTLYTLCEGIIGGQGNGPLDPDPLPLGVLAFSNDPYLMDEVMAELFSMNVKKIPLLLEASILNESKDTIITINGREANMDDIRKLKIEVDLAPGWVDYNV